MKKIPRYSVVPWLYCNLNDAILICLVVAIFNTSSGIKYVLSQLTVVVKVTACVLFV